VRERIKTRVISIRVSEAVYSELDKLRRQQGVDSISEVVRVKLWEETENLGSNDQGSLNSTLSRLDDRVVRLGREIKKVARVLGAIRRVAEQPRTATVERSTADLEPLP